MSPFRNALHSAYDCVLKYFTLANKYNYAACCDISIKLHVMPSSRKGMVTTGFIGILLKNFKNSFEKSEVGG